MSVTVLSLASAYNPGSDLWIVPDLETSKLTKKLDWHLNFQISRHAQHARLQLPENIYSVLKKTNLEVPNPVRSEQLNALMISTEHLLPNRWVVALPGSNELEDWANQIHTIWKGLKSPSLRVFLPTQINAAQFTSTWSQKEAWQDFTLVSE